jgi:hypothetical protein
LPASPGKTIRRMHASLRDRRFASFSFNAVQSWRVPSRSAIG